MRMHPRDALMLCASSDIVTNNYVIGYVFTTDGAVPLDLDRDAIVDWLVARARSIPELRNHVVRVPLDLARPVLWPDAELSFGSHIHVDDTLTWAELQRHASELVQHKFDMDRPLWDLHVAMGVDGVLGFAGSSTVVMLRIHHSIVDGMGSVEIARTLFAEKAPDPAPVVDAGSKPSRAGLFVKSLITAPGSFAAFLWSLRKTFAGRRAVKAEVTQGNVPVQKFERSIVPFLGRPGPRRVLDCVPLSVTEMRAVRAAVGDVSMNDVVLTVVSLALTRYLDEKGIEVPHSLGTSMPISTRGLTPDSGSHNQFVPSIVTLHTDVTDPIERLRLVHDSARESIAVQTSPGKVENGALYAAAPGWVLDGVYGAVARLQKAGQPYPVHTSVSSLFKSGTGWKLGNASATASFGAICLEAVLGMTHLIDTIGDVATISVTSDPDLFEDSGRYAELLELGWKDLRQAAFTE